MQAKGKNRNIKNLIFLTVSALVLISASLAWFMNARKNTIAENTANIASSSSNAVFYEAIDADRNGYITEATEPYTEIESTNIVTEGMYPNHTYFYKVKLDNIISGYSAGLVFSDIMDNDSLGGHINVSAKLVERASGAVVAQLTPTVLSSLYSVSESGNITSAKLFGTPVTKTANYDLYYTVQVDKNTTSDFEGKSLSVQNVNVIVSSSDIGA